MNVESSTGRLSIARWWHLEDDRVRCELCPHSCLLVKGGTGRCHVRKNVGGVLHSMNYGKMCVSAIDPIEKKPMFHYRPGSKLFSIGTFGCNMRCDNCQNFSLASSSGDDIPHEEWTPEEVVEHALEKGADGISYTFNEPTIWYEFVYDVSELARQHGLYTMMNTNGYTNPGPLEELLPLVDAFNVDLKSFSDQFYEENCGATRGPVMDTCSRIASAGTHLEVTYLLITGMNDSTQEITELCEWVAKELGEDTPLHLFRFLPFHRLSHIEEQTMDKLDEAYQIAQSAGLRFPYYAGVTGHPRQNTSCPECGATLIERQSQQVEEKISVKEDEISRFCPTYPSVVSHLEDGSCPRCGAPIPIIT